MAIFEEGVAALAIWPGEKVADRSTLTCLLGVNAWLADGSFANGEIAKSEKVTPGVIASFVLVPKASKPATADSSLSLNMEVEGCVSDIP